MSIYEIVFFDRKTSYFVRKTSIWIKENVHLLTGKRPYIFLESYTTQYKQQAYKHKFKIIYKFKKSINCG